MEKFVVSGGYKLTGQAKVSGAKNVVLKAIIAACLTDEEVIIKNVPLISDIFTMVDIVKEIGGIAKIEDHTLRIRLKKVKNYKLSLETAARVRTSFMFIVPLIIRAGRAVVPNPGGCRLGARPVDRLIAGLNKMGAKITYNHNDGFFYSGTATQNNQHAGLKGAEYTFDKNTHTGTETMILAGACAKGRTILNNAAEEPEIDELIDLLNKMGADIKRVNGRKIVINGTGGEMLKGTTFTIGADRNEIVTFACAGIITKGDVFIKGAKKVYISDFVDRLTDAGAGIEIKDDGIRFFYKKPLRAIDVETKPYPGFMTDWQAPWAVLMTQAEGESVIHETVFENKLGYINEIMKMGAKAKLFNPKVDNPEEVYNFNLKDDSEKYFHAVKITGPVKLHNAVITMLDIRAGAAVLLAALCAKGDSTIYDIEKLDRGYENFEKRLGKLGAKIKRVKKQLSE